MEYVVALLETGQWIVTPCEIAYFNLDQGRVLEVRHLSELPSKSHAAIAIRAAQSQMARHWIAVGMRGAKRRRHAFARRGRLNRMRRAKREAERLEGAIDWMRYEGDTRRGIGRIQSRDERGHSIAFVAGIESGRVNRDLKP
jgi:hypothetical protein